jgi:hypothetical protein
MMAKKNSNQFDNQFFNRSIENSLDDDLNILNNFQKKEEEKDFFPVDLSGIDQSMNLKGSI